MKTTGIIRRIDELGRIVIPKEIRKTLKLKDGENLEISVLGEDIVLRKYSPIENLGSTVDNYVNIFNQVIKKNIIVTDRNKIIATSNNISNKYLNKEISNFVDRTIDRRDSFVERQKKAIQLIETEEETGFFSFCSIVASSEALGCVIIFSNDLPLTEAEEKQAVILSKILSKHFIE